MQDRKTWVCPLLFSRWSTTCDLCSRASQPEWPMVATRRHSGQTVPCHTQGSGAAKSQPQAARFLKEKIMNDKFGLTRISLLILLATLAACCGGGSSGGSATTEPPPSGTAPPSSGTGAPPAGTLAIFVT